MFAFFQTRASTRGMERELERHALVLADSLSKTVEPLVEYHSYRELQRQVDRFKDASSSHRHRGIRHER